MNIKSLLLGSAAALAALACVLPIPDAMASPGGVGGCSNAFTVAMTDPWESPAIGGDQTVLGPQLAIKEIIEPEDDGGMRKHNPPSYPVGWVTASAFPFGWGELIINADPIDTKIDKKPIILKEGGGRI